MTDSYLVISALGANQPNVVTKFTDGVVNCGGNILTSRMTILGREFGAQLLVSGAWDVIAKIESLLPTAEKKLGMSIAARRTSAAEYRKAITYSVGVVSIDRHAILNDLARFFTCQDIDIEDVNATTYLNSNSARMVNMTFLVNLDENVHIPSLREKFMLYCDALNIDASIEPFKE